MTEISEETITQIAAELVNQDAYSRKNLADAISIYQGDVKAAVTAVLAIR